MGRPLINSAVQFTTIFQHINVADCKQQQYTSTINGEQMILVSGNDIEESYDLGKHLERFLSCNHCLNLD